VIGRVHHLDDDRLCDAYFAERVGDAADPRVGEHLADCGECRTRYTEFVHLMDDVRAEGDAETDEIFTADRLRAQSLAIARRIEHVGRAARVISFPGRFVGRRMSVTGRRGLTRWIYAAAAAGLVIGVGLTALYDSEFRRLQRGHAFVATTPAVTTAPRVNAVATGGNSPAVEATDEAFLSDLEVALERPRTRELQPFDALTPRVRDIK
jgi:anti-sigma factor RsiW